MNEQKEAWEFEYKEHKGFPTSIERRPSNQVKYFLKFLKSKNITKGKILDIGCGFGRNSIFLAKKGYNIWAFDFVEEALEFMRKKVNELGLGNKINISNQDAFNTWKFKNGFFDAVIDITTFDSIENKEHYINELYRVLKPKGYFCIYAILPEHEYLKKLNNFNSKDNIKYFVLGLDKLMELFSSKFHILEEKRFNDKKELIHGESFKRELARIIMQKND
ncbi:MAG: methyltransferase domain-containing protein [Nanoarchaeota archaeon]